jgi:hypothetical protein
MATLDDEPRWARAKMVTYTYDDGQQKWKSHAGAIKSGKSCSAPRSKPGPGPDLRQYQMPADSAADDVLPRVRDFKLASLQGQGHMR